MSWTCETCGHERKASNESPGRIYLNEGLVDAPLCETCSEMLLRWIVAKGLRNIINGYQTGEQL
jgi:hypothetical protein